MPDDTYPHIFLRNAKQSDSYTPRPRRIELPPDLPHFNQLEHGPALERAYRQAIFYAQQQFAARGIDPAHADQGLAVEFSFRPGSKIDVTSLENAQGGKKIDVLNVKLDERGQAISALLYIPHRKKEFLNNQLGKYSDPEKNTGGNPSNYKKYDKTENIVLATLQDFWIDTSAFPEAMDTVSTWEVWLREDAYEIFQENAANMEGIAMSGHYIAFPERKICAVHGSLNDLDILELQTKAISGFRYLRTGAGFFESMPPAEQRQWQDEMLERLTIPDDLETTVCILDTGIYQEHPLLQLAIADNGVDSYNPAVWGAGDHHGHGTEMAGIALLGDLTPLLDSQEDFELTHLLESVKVFPPEGQNEDELVGYITAQAVARAEANNPRYRRVFCLSWAIGHEDQRNGVMVTGGKPSPLSARVDQLAFGVEESNDWEIDDERKRLLVVAAGNIREWYDPEQYPAINDLHEIEDPAQSWNALTVGAMTDKVFSNDPTYNGWQPIAGSGQLAPMSRTSVLWGSNPWPIKPEIVFEGGNVLHDGAGYSQPAPDTLLLTTDKDRIFCCTGDTSAANAGVARLAASLTRKYPDLWPESVRGLMVHASQWTQGMLGAEDVAGWSKNRKIAFLRRNGYGTPVIEHLLNSYSNRPCIVIQDTLQPFAESQRNTNIVFGDMNHYELPWPQESLEQIFDQAVQLKVTLSFFIEPSPSERPPKKKHSYASHELRFKLNRPNEPQDIFLARVNQELQLEEINEALDQYQVSEIADQDNWVLGPQTRDRGSVITDIWRGTGAELASQNLLAVIPQQGWWKHRKVFPDRDNPRYSQKVRYALILSLSTEAAIDLYTPIVQEIENVSIVSV
jgi:hypothetical protein